MPSIVPPLIYVILLLINAALAVLNLRSWRRERRVISLLAALVHGVAALYAAVVLLAGL